MANEFFVLHDGTRAPIPNEIVSEGREAVAAYVKAQGWRPPAAAAPIPTPSPATADPEE